jgi:hypothetical protein
MADRWKSGEKVRDFNFKNNKSISKISYKPLDVKTKEKVRLDKAKKSTTIDCSWKNPEMKSKFKKKYFYIFKTNLTTKFAMS